MAKPGIPLEIGGTIENRDDTVAFVFGRVTNWGGVQVSYAHLEEGQTGFKPGDRVKGTIVPDLDQDRIVIQRLEQAEPV